MQLEEKVLNVCANRSSYPDRKEGEEEEEAEEELPDDGNLEYDEDTLELTLPSGDSMGGVPEMSFEPSL